MRTAFLLQSFCTPLSIFTSPICWTSLPNTKETSLSKEEHKQGSHQKRKRCYLISGTSCTYIAALTFLSKCNQSPNAFKKFSSILRIVSPYRLYSKCSFEMCNIRFIASSFSDLLLSVLYEHFLSHFRTIQLFYFQYFSTSLHTLSQYTLRTLSNSVSTASSSFTPSGQGHYLDRTGKQNGSYRPDFF